jgi:DNA-binding transcriptional ArsR family regulator
MLDTLSSRQIDQWLSALADPTRRRIVEILSESPRTATEIHQAFPIAGPAVSRHLRVLREAAVLVQRDVPGDKRVRLYALAHDPIDGIGTWLQQLSSSSTWGDQLGAFQDYVALRQQKESKAPLGESP